MYLSYTGLDNCVLRLNLDLLVFRKKNRYFYTTIALPLSRTEILDRLLFRRKSIGRISNIVES